MKNMDYEKKYKEALNWMRELYPGLHGATKEDAEHYFPELKESEDERIRKFICSIIDNLEPKDFVGVKKMNVLAWLEKQKERGPLTKEEEYTLHRIIEYLEDETCPSEWISLLYDIYCLPYEKQKENIEKEYVFRPLAETDITTAAEQAIRRADEGDRLVLAFNGAYIPVRKGCNANKIVDIYDAFTKKQNKASKAIEAVEKIDKYIDEHLANAHDMKDSEPDKKYYRGWDDALGKMAGMLQDVYSEEKKKDNKFTPRVLPCSAAWFEDCEEKQKEQPQEELVYRMNGLMQEYVKEGEDDAEKEHRLKCYQLFWDALEDADFFEQKEQKPSDEQFPPLEGLDAIKAKYYDNGFKNGFDEGVESVKQAEWSEGDKETIDLTIAVLKENLPNGYFKTNPANTLNMGAISTDELINRLKSLSPQPKQEWSEEDKAMIDDIIFSLPRMANGSIEILPSVAKSYSERLKSLKDRGNFPKSNTNSPSEWSEEDEKMRDNILRLLSCFVGTSECDSNPSLSTSYPAYQKEMDWLKSLPLNLKKKNEDVEKLCSNEWSEEDAEMYINVASSLRGYACGLENEEHKRHIKKGLDWLENRFKSLRPQSKDEIHKGGIS